MSKDEALRDLIERVEKATGPDRELDCRIWCALGGGGGAAMFEACRVFVPDLNQWQAPRYTASIDAAMTLAPQGRSLRVQQRRSYEPIWVSFMADGSTEYDATGRAKTLALAITAASLRAHMGTGG